MTSSQSSDALGVLLGIAVGIIGGTKDEIQQLKADSKQLKDGIVRLIPFDDFKQLGQIPRCPENRDILVNYDDTVRDESLYIFMSHCWLRGCSGAPGWDGRPHPDTSNHDKYQLMVAAVEKIMSSLTTMSKCYIWLDVGCIDQDVAPCDELRMLDKIVGVCDLILTNVHDTQDWELPKNGCNIFEDYKSPAWNGSDYAYLSRGWCRVDMLYAANIRLENSSAARVNKFKAGLLLSGVQAGCRPHLLYGTREHRLALNPIILPPLNSLLFYEYNPVEGKLCNESDREKIQQLVTGIEPYMKRVRTMSDFLRSTGKGVVGFNIEQLRIFLTDSVQQSTIIDINFMNDLLEVFKNAMGLSSNSIDDWIPFEEFNQLVDEVELDIYFRDIVGTLEQIRLNVMEQALEMALQQDRRRWRRSRLMILGEGRAGKSSFLRALSGKSFVPSLVSTKGLAVEDFKVEAEIRDAGVQIRDYKRWTEQPFDVMEGEQALRQTTSHLARGKLTKRVRNRRIELVTSKIEQVAPGVSTVDRVVPVSQTSLTINEVLQPVPSVSSMVDDAVKNVASHADTYSAESDSASILGDFSNVSNKDANMITFSVWDYGGQRVFQTMQHILLTRNGVFSLVFDMNNVSPRTATQECIHNSLLYIKHWLRQIDMLAKGAPIFLIGTHKDRLFSEDVHHEINTVLLGVVQGHKVNHNGNLCFYPVDNTNTNDPVIGGLRHLLEDAAENDPVGYVNEEIPTSWLNMCDRLHQMARDDTPYIFRENPDDVVDTPDIRVIALDCGVIEASMDSVQQNIIITSMLTKMHEKGTYLYFPFEKSMHNIVVLKPQWIIDMIVFIMRDFTLHPFNRDNYIVKKYPNEWLKICRHGVLLDSILSIFWREEIHNKEFLMSMLEKLKIAARLPYSDSQGNSIYLLPSVVLSSDNIPHDIPIPLNWRDNWMNECSGLVKLRFVEESIPEGFFSRLIVQIISMISSTSSILPASLPSFVSQLTSLNAPCVFFCNGAYCAAIVLEDSHVIVLRPSTDDLMIEVFVPSASLTILPACGYMIRSAIDELNKILYNNCLRFEVSEEVINQSSIPRPSTPPLNSCSPEEVVYAHPFNEEDGEEADEERLLKVLVAWLMSSGRVKIRKHAEKYAGFLIEDGFYTVETLHENFINGRVTREKLKELGITADLNITNILEALKGMPSPLALADSFLASFFCGRDTELMTVEHALSPTKKMDHWRMHEKSVGFLASTLQSRWYTFLHLSADPATSYESLSNKKTLPFMRTDSDCTFPEPELLVDVVTSCMRHGTWNTLIEGVFINASNSWNDLGLYFPTQNKHVVVIGWKTRIDIAGSELFAGEFYRYLRDYPGKYGDAYKAAKWQLLVHHNYFCEDPDDVTKLNNVRATNNPRACFVGIPHIITPTEFDIFFSHPWANKNVLRHVKGFLEKKGYRVWYDEDEIGWNMKKCMEEGIMRSKVVLVCLNSPYEGRKNCMFELKEAKSINKTIVTLICQPNPLDNLPSISGWAGKITTFGNAMDLCSLEAMKYYDIGELFQRPEWAENPVTPVDPVILATLLVELEAKVDDLCLLLRDKEIKCDPFY